MSNSLSLAVFGVSLIIFIVVFTLLKRGRIPLKFALIWFAPVLVIFLVAIFPQFLVYFTNLMGFQTIANMISGLLIVILIFICIALTVIVSGQKTKITLMIQEVSIMKKRITDLEKVTKVYDEK